MRSISPPSQRSDIRQPNSPNRFHHDRSISRREHSPDLAIPQKRRGDPFSYPIQREPQQQNGRDREIGMQDEDYDSFRNKKRRVDDMDVDFYGVDPSTNSRPPQQDAFPQRYPGDRRDGPEPFERFRMRFPATCHITF